MTESRDQGRKESAKIVLKRQLEILDCRVTQHMCVSEQENRTLAFQDHMSKIMKQDGVILLQEIEQLKQDLARQQKTKGNQQLLIRQQSLTIEQLKQDLARQQETEGNLQLSIRRQDLTIDVMKHALARQQNQIEHHKLEVVQKQYDIQRQQAERANKTTEAGLARQENQPQVEQQTDGM